jgi:hypothetical protein
VSINAQDILGVTKAVTKEWTKARRAEERGSRSAHERCYIYSDRVDFTEVAEKILPGAYNHASGGGRYSVSKRTFFYSCRESFRKETGRELKYNYFAGTLLVQYINRHPETAAWKVTADPRGNLTIPNADHKIQIPCGTLEIEEHLKEANQKWDPFDIEAEVPIQWPSIKGGQRYQGVVYIEKEGFSPLLEEAKIAQRFDVAVLSCKGQSVVAARRFIDEVCHVGGGVPLFVVHDFDKAGFEISQRLTSVSDWAQEYDRVTYEFRHDINVTDLGLRLTDVAEYGLTGEYCQFKGDFASDSICTSEEKGFLLCHRRVELNEFTSPQFVQWLEAKLTEHLPKRLVPDDAILADAYRRALVTARLNHATEKLLESATEKAKQAGIPSNLRRRMRKAMKDTPDEAWDSVLYGLVYDKLYPDDED